MVNWLSCSFNLLFEDYHWRLYSDFSETVFFNPWLNGRCGSAVLQLCGYSRPSRSVGLAERALQWTRLVRQNTCCQRRHQYHTGWKQVRFSCTSELTSREATDKYKEALLGHPLFKDTVIKQSPGNNVFTKLTVCVCWLVLSACRPELFLKHVLSVYPKAWRLLLNVQNTWPLLKYTLFSLPHLKIWSF